MNPSTIRSKLNSLGIKLISYDFGWSQGVPAVRVGSIITPIPVNDCQDEAFAEYVADIVQHPEKYKLDAEINSARMAKHEPN